MDGYETDGSSALDPVFNDDSSLDNQWSADASGTGLRAISGGGQGGPASDRSKFSVIQGGKSAARNAEARAAGRAAENGASGGITGQDAKNLEENSPFVNNVSGKEDEKKRKKRKRISTLKVIGPSGILIVIIGIIVSLIAGSQFLFPFALVANGLEQFNAAHTSMNRRGNVFMRMTLGGRNHAYTRVGGIFGDDFTVSRSLQRKFAKNKITYVDDAGGVKILYYVDEDTGQKMAIAANPEDASRVPSRITVPEYDSNGRPTGRTIEVDVDTRIDLEQAKKISNNFNNAQNSATLTIRGRVSAWWDSISDLFHGRISALRNYFNGLQDTADASEVKAAAKANALNTDIPDETLANPKKESGIDTGETEEVETTRPITDAGGEVVGSETVTEEVPIISVDEFEGSAALSKGLGDNITEIGDRLQNRAKKSLLNSKGATLTCMVMRTLGSISMVVAGLQVVQILNYITRINTSIHQAQIGDGGTPMNVVMKDLNTSGPTKDAYGNVIEGKENSNTMTSKPIYSFFGGSPVTPDDPSAQKFNTDYAMSHAIENKMASESGNPELGDFFADLGTRFLVGASSVALGMTAYKTCNAIRMVDNGMQLVGQAVSLIGGFVSGGLTLVLSRLATLVKGILDQATWAAAQAAVAVFVAAIVPYVAQWLLMDLFENPQGEDPGYAIDSGWNIYAGKQMQQGSGLPGTANQVLTQYRQTQEVLAEEARYDRSTHSPFDITNKNTFLGSLAHAAIPIATTMSNSSLFSTVSQVANTVGSSVVSLFPSVKAAGDETWYTLSQNTECPGLSTLGLVGDAYCNPYYVSDYDTVEMDPAEVFLAICEDNFEKGCETEDTETASVPSNVIAATSGGLNSTAVEDGSYAYNPKIKDDSEFAKWIVSCTVREAPLAYLDEHTSRWSISTGNTTLDAILNAGVGVVPLGGDFVDLMQGGEALANIDWSNGQICNPTGNPAVASEEPGIIDKMKVYMERIRMYSRYSEDQRLFEAMGLVEESAVASFLKEHYKKNPVDNSLEGIIARYTGMNMAKVDETLDVIAYVNYIANYEPEERRQLAVNLLESAANNRIQTFDNGDDLPAQEYIIMPELNKFADLRNRTLIA